tara:strand:+ start:260 stop:418 length:159 start_codon:yes stop_codon:yes gene_type:complete
VLVTVIVVGATVVVDFGVHVRMMFAGVVPADPTLATCVAAMVRAPCPANAVT